MDGGGGKAMGSGVKKPKKKQVKDELDRIKQAEKKKRRLEKALATSAAIISELEKKKQKKKEEQERLDEEGAAIAESVALHVLRGEDSDDSTKLVLKKNEGPTTWDYAGEVVRGRTALLPRQDPPKYSLPNAGWVTEAHKYEFMRNQCGNSGMTAPPDRMYSQYFGVRGWSPLGLSADHLAAQAVSSLRIADDARVDAFAFNRVLKG
ncbi:uncharacterized protein LOC127259684 [Andrographis paniculata]|uniref:uncharacterized protein LOC127259684 n=1 Tax=Andrographis paniculata TaxID=175694 RepID=UPI0021E7AC30|nr:uncharacterized protein LOC127259684 [Andrographis paniculata]XP_051143159.1 uncharacterized protein LOC127259684 [Andrographis paniculata]XP_051143160.1 uncharacterized protein LOC127259684 [Andrographis paniculata]XP_051143161.1 uncharacterized protein LOC127259684 [Andrographis paniculata]